MTAHRAHAEELAPEWTVSMRVIRGLSEVVKQAGPRSGDAAPSVLIDAEQLSDPEARVPIATVFQLCERAMDLTCDPALGLHWAERVSSSTFVPVSHLVTHSGSLRQGLASLSQFHRLLSDRTSFELIEAGDDATLRCPCLGDESPRVRRFAAEMAVAGFHRHLCAFDSGRRSMQVSFEYAAPDYRAEYVRVFGESVRFDQPYTGIRFERALLDAPAPNQDLEVHEALRTLAERRLLRIGLRAPYALRVRELLVKQASPNHSDMRTVAASLGLSVRSLRRRLDAEGKSFNEIANEALAMTAKQLLRDEQRSIQQTADALGFADTSTFHRAFKRWTGVTPAAFRQGRLQAEKRD